MTNRPRVAILSFSDIQRDGRVQRQIDYLSRHFSVTVIAYDQLEPQLAERARTIPILPPTSPQRRGRKAVVLPLGRLLSPRVYDTWYWSEREYAKAVEILGKIEFDATHANDWDSLPLAVRAAQKTETPVVAGLHEYGPLMRANSAYWRWLYRPKITYFLRKTLSHASRTVPISRPLASRYLKECIVEPAVAIDYRAARREV